MLSQPLQWLFFCSREKSQPFYGWRNVENILTVDISSKQVDTSTVAVDISINKVEAICFDSVADNSNDVLSTWEAI